ncbi:heterokaryon incompatibility protein-domain-containing protein [Paraphoma chrysanthemicola]|nr:heterokaryon incompatibility protein-domain-containing protein [Paraphoma chrysanthemicola]
MYKQRILSGRTFRLLFVHPAKDKHQQLVCSSRPFDIDAAPSFEAVSYVWGSPEPAAQLLCNGQPFVVQPALASALTRLRLQRSTRVLWADAICINQSDIEEKNHQVPLMGQIYSLAERVAVWLGPAHSKHTRKALEVVEYIAAACVQYDREHNRNPGHNEEWDHVHLPMDRFTLAACASLKELFERPWFRRIWCLQEIRLAREASIICGEHVITWETLSMAASWIFKKYPTFENFLSHDLVLASLAHVEVLPAYIMNDRVGTDLLTTLDGGRGFYSTDPRDKVYGIMNVVSPKSEAENIVVDYDKSVAEVYADTVLAIIRSYSRLDAFSCITHPLKYNGDDGYRSWAPRWDSHDIATSIGHPFLGCPWDASRSKQATLINDNLSSDTLCLQGLLYDDVSEVGEVYHRMFPDVTSRSRGSDSPSRSNLDLLARTVAAGRMAQQYVEELDPDTKERCYQTFAESMLKLDRLRFSDQDNYTPDADVEQFVAGASLYCNQRRMFWSKNRSLGLGPQCMEVGDIVVVLYGGNTPYVLRQRGDKHLFMGQAYIDNIMHGEVVEDLHAGKMQEVMFCLI